MDKNRDQYDQRLEGLFALKSGWPDNIAADDGPEGAEHNKRGGDIHNPGVVEEKAGVFQRFVEAEAPADDDKYQVEGDVDKEPPGHKGVTQAGPVLGGQVFKLAPLPEYPDDGS
ncbi:hypothetical protein ES703_27132 [subsurface metagenome]